jgi:hypothetical protein
MIYSIRSAEAVDGSSDELHAQNGVKRMKWTSWGTAFGVGMMLGPAISWAVLIVGATIFVGVLTHFWVAIALCAPIVVVGSIQTSRQNEGLAAITPTEWFVRHRRVDHAPGRYPAECGQCLWHHLGAGTLNR